MSICPDVFDENIVLVVGHIPATKRKEGAKIYCSIDDADSIQRFDIFRIVEDRVVTISS